MKLFKCVLDVTIGNGAGRFAFEKGSEFTERDLLRAGLSEIQKMRFFKSFERDPLPSKHRFSF